MSTGLTCSTGLEGAQGLCLAVPCGGCGFWPCTCSVYPVLSVGSALHLLCVPHSVWSPVPHPLCARAAPCRQHGAGPPVSASASLDLGLTLNNLPSGACGLPVTSSRGPVWWEWTVAPKASRCVSPRRHLQPRPSWAALCWRWGHLALGLRLSGWGDPPTSMAELGTH